MQRSAQKKHCIPALYYTRAGCGCLENARTYTLLTERAVSKYSRLWMRACEGKKRSRAARARERCPPNLTNAYTRAVITAIAGVAASTRESSCTPSVYVWACSTRRVSVVCIISEWKVGRRWVLTSMLATSLPFPLDAILTTTRSVTAEHLWRRSPRASARRSPHTPSSSSCIYLYVYPIFRSLDFLPRAHLLHRGTLALSLCTVYLQWSREKLHRLTAQKCAL